MNRCNFSLCPPSSARCDTSHSAEHTEGPDLGESGSSSMVRAQWSFGDIADSRFGEEKNMMTSHCTRNRM